MTITTWPIDATPAVPGRQLREAQSVYMAGAAAADPFGVRSGVRPGTSPTTVTATSTTWTVGAHAGVVDLQPAVEASGYAYAVNATGGLPTGAVTAADLTRPRIDIVWVRNDDPTEADGSPNPTVVFGYTAGAPLAVPVAPATPARCMVLATIQVPLSGGGAPTVIWVAPYTVAAGAPTPVWSAADRDAKFPVPYDGLQVYRLDLHLTQTYTSTAWNTGSGTPFAMAAGIIAVSSGGVSNVVFPVGRFTVPPILTLGMSYVIASGNAATSLAYYVYAGGNSLTKDGVGLRTLTTDIVNVSWTAVQMTPTSAAG